MQAEAENTRLRALNAELVKVLERTADKLTEIARVATAKAEGKGCE